MRRQQSHYVITPYLRFIHLGFIQIAGRTFRQNNKQDIKTTFLLDMNRKFNLKLKKIKQSFRNS